MSADASHSTATADEPPADSPVHARPADEPIFTRSEIAHFEEEDALAGRAIGKMLALFFVYTVVVMSIAAWWTYSSWQRDEVPAAEIDAADASTSIDEGAEPTSADE